MPRLSHRPQPFASDAWMRAQQLRAELEAEEWRLLREETARAEAALSQAMVAPRAEPTRGGSIILKGLVRFLLGVLGAYVGYIAAITSGGGDIDAWIGVVSGFVIALALTAFGAGRDFVHAVSETARWIILLACGVGATWLIVQIAAG